MKTVAVFFGGNSNEREISIITGMFAVNLLREKANVIPVYLDGGRFYSSKRMRAVADFQGTIAGKFPEVTLEGREIRRRKHKKGVVLDCALNCCHGGAGEDGTLSALLEWKGVPLASPSVAVSSVFMSKELGKIAARGLGLPVLESVTVREGEDAANVEALGYPVIVKPARLGSSIGIKVARNREELDKALELAFRLDTSALVERYLAGKRDINCAACRLRGEIMLSPCEEVFSDEEILSFAEKYEGASGRASQLPANLPDEMSAKIREYTRRIYESFGVRGVVRADFLVAGDKVYFNELNTVPGSLACYLFSDTLTASRDFLLALLDEAKPLPEKLTLNSGILQSGVFSAGKGKGCVL